ncbi:chemotaxis protein [Stakelama sp. CBK3Z-3]|uniref:Chemotaxis protein n=1 Tax=Stakelama flava TaxID=2860338 RepID=A0ABS6XLU4_9SPHN|nr:methyl-accepting chemotaxis protein [Stakelama flava]MBW4331184.1 chemotaxis protein [Stakelama flava]
MTYQHKRHTGDREAAIDALKRRLDAYDEDGAVAPACTEILALISDRVESVAFTFLDTLGRDKGAFAPGGWLTGERYQRQLRASAEYVRLKYSSPLGRDWLHAAVRNVELCQKLRIPMHAFLSAIAICNSRLMAILQEEIGEDSPRVARLCDVVQRLAMVEAAVMVEHAAYERDRAARAEREQRASTFQQDIGSTLHHTADLGQRIRVQAQTASQSTGGMLGKAGEVAAAAEQSAVAMREAARTAAGLIRAIEDTRSEVEGASQVATRASEQAGSAVERSEALNDHAKSIEAILGLIRDIAGQTNLLALNATIEAARAGDAGRGFAVVAQEVKSLANQTARATDEIAAKVAAIQDDIRSTVQINASVSTTVGDVRHSAGRIRGAMESQAKTVTAITSAVDETALTADSMANTIAAIRRDIESVSGDMTALSGETAQVDELLARLKGEADRFSQSGTG